MQFLKHEGYMFYFVISSSSPYSLFKMSRNASPLLPLKKRLFTTEQHSFPEKVNLSFGGIFKNQLAPNSPFESCTIRE